MAAQLSIQIAQHANTIL